MIKHLKDINKNIVEAADFCVIGTGAGGAVIAKELAQAGKKVIVLEEGSYYHYKDFPKDILSAMKMLYRDQGMRAMVGKSLILTMQAKCVGGTTVLNSGICFRIPDNVLNEWINDFGLKDISPEILAKHYEQVEKIINVKPVEEKYLGKNNLLFKKGCDALGFSSAAMLRNEKDCKGCGVCMLGCPEGARQSMDITYVPQACNFGAKIYANCRAEKLIIKKGKVLGVEGTFREPQTAKGSKFKITVRAKAVILSAGAVGSPVFLLNNKAANSSKMVGKNFTNHPGSALIGYFEEEVNSWFGASQGYESAQFMDEGFLLETVWAPVEVLSARLPGFGLKYKNLIAKFKHFACWGAMIKGNSKGEVKASGWNPVLIYNLTDEDVRKIQKALKIIADMFFAAGAKKIITAIYGLPKIIKDPQKTDIILKKKLHSQSIIAIGNHPMGTCKMGEDKKNSVVNSHCETHDIKDLYVCDASIFPTPLGVNPQLTIMAFATHTAEYLKKRYG